MNKQEIASYLASLLTLMEGQDTSGVHNRSQVLGDEFNKYWDRLKVEIEQEKENETRKRKHIDKRHEATDHHTSSQPSSSGADWESPIQPRSGADVGFGGPSSHEPV